MRKVNKKILFLVIGILLAVTIDVAAEAVMSSEMVSYSNAATNQTTVSGALDELFSAVNINGNIGDISKISNIGDGTITGAISTTNEKLNDFMITSLVKVPIVVPANGIYKPNTTVETISGYTPLFAFVRGSGSNCVYNYYVYMTTPTNLYTEWRNICSGEINSSAYITVVYTKNV